MVWNVFFSHILGMSSSQLTPSFFRGVVVYHQADYNVFAAGIGVVSNRNSSKVFWYGGKGLKSPRMVYVYIYIYPLVI